MAQINLQTKKQNVAILDKLMYVTRVEKYSQIPMKEVIEHAAIDSGISRAVCGAAIEAFLLQLRELMLNGHSVTLGDMGTFRFSIRAKAVEKKDDVVLDKIIKSRKVIFTPSPELKAAMKKVKFVNNFTA